MADVRVRFPLGALNLRVWESLVLARASGARDRWFKSSHPDLVKDCGGTRAGTGRRPLTALTQVRFLPLQLLNTRTEGQANWRWHPARTGTSFTALRVRLPLLPLTNSVLLAERQRLQASNLARRVRFPQSTLQIDGSVAQRQSRCLLSTSARVRVPPVPL